ncbi:MAG: 6-phosphogluconate dehydrogenase [Flavobacterium sp.]
MAFVYYVPYSEGVRSGELIKISHKGVVVKTWEGEISQGISGAQIFKFSVMPSNKQLIQQLEEYQGKYVKLKYEEKLRTFFWWGDTRYFIKEVTLEDNPHYRKSND